MTILDISTADVSGPEKISACRIAHGVRNGLRTVKSVSDVNRMIEGFWSLGGLLYS